MSLDDFIDKKNYLIETINMEDVLIRYGVRIYGNRCKCPIVDHGRKDTSCKVFDNGIKCWTCNKSYNIFDVVMKFENCDFSTAVEILGGKNDISEQTKNKMEEAKRLRELERHKEQQAQYELNHVANVIKSCEKRLSELEYYSNEWVKYYNLLQYNVYKWDKLFKGGN